MPSKRASATGVELRRTWTWWSGLRERSDPPWRKMESRADPAGTTEEREKG